jgi:hypothetical protein
MNRNIILIIILLAFSAIAYYAWKTKKDPSTNMERADSNFKIEDVNSIYRIVITNKEGMRSDLKRSGDHWIINDQHRARQTTVDHLLKGISRQLLDHIPTKEASENIIASMAVNGIHVEIYGKDDKELLSYYVGGVTQDERVTYFLKEGSDQPYGLIEPGFDGALRVRYSLRPVDWRDVRFWVEENEKIDTLKVHYPKQRHHSFVIYKNGSDYEIMPMFGTTPKKGKENEVKIKSYLTTLSKLAGENFLDPSFPKDSILQSVAFMEMDMIYPDKTSYLNFYPIVATVKTEFSTDIPRYYIDYAGKDFMVGQHEVVKGAFRSYEYFFD